MSEASQELWPLRPTTTSEVIKKLESSPTRAAFIEEDVSSGDYSGAARRLRERFEVLNTIIEPSGTDQWQTRQILAVAAGAYLATRRPDEKTLAQLNPGLEEYFGEDYPLVDATRKTIELTAKLKEKVPLGKPGFRLVLRPDQISSALSLSPEVLVTVLKEGNLEADGFYKFRQGLRDQELAPPPVTPEEIERARREGKSIYNLSRWELGPLRYVNLTLLAYRSNSLVFTAYDKRLGQTVVLKMLRVENEEEKERLRLALEKEAAVQAKLGGEAPVVKVFDFTIQPKPRDLSLEDILEILPQIAKAVT